MVGATALSSLGLSVKLAEIIYPHMFCLVTGCSSEWVFRL